MERHDDQTVDLGSATEETRGAVPGIREPGGKDFLASGMSDDD